MGRNNADFHETANEPNMSGINAGTPNRTVSNKDRAKIASDMKKMFNKPEEDTDADAKNSRMFDGGYGVV